MKRLADVVPYPLEAEVQAAIIELFVSVGGQCYSTSQGYRQEPGGTRCTPGISDLIVFFPRRHMTLFWETKTHTGRRTQAQVVFGNAAGECNEYGWGGVDEAVTYLRSIGLVP